MIAITLSKLAALANVSISTVSKAFSGSKEVSKETREMIFQIARENKCYDKFYKKAYYKPIIGVICPEFGSRLYGDYLTIMEKEISKRDATLIVGCTDFKLKNEQALLEYYTTFAKVSGIIIISPASKKISNYSVPIVSIGLCNNIDSIHYDSEKSIYDAVNYFHENGHKKIGFIGEERTNKKEEHFYNAMNRLNLKIDKSYVEISKKRFEDAGYSAMEAMFDRQRVPTAILAAYDYIAIGIMHSIKGRGMRVPDDISIIGIDDIEEVAYLNIPLTTIKMYKQEACAIASDILFKKIENPYFSACQRIEIPSQLIKRNSVSNLYMIK